MRCPKCGEEISYLRNYVPAIMVYTLTLDRSGNRSYYPGDTIPDDSGDDGTYECPECNAKLAYNEDDALAFLRGEGIRQEMVEYYMKLAMEGGNNDQL